MKKCPYCAEDIQDEAIKCRYCKEALVSQNIEPGITIKKTPKVKLVSLPLMYWVSISVCILYFISGAVESTFSSWVYLFVFLAISPFAWIVADKVREYAEPSAYFSSGFFDSIGKRFFWSYGPQMFTIAILGFFAFVLSQPSYQNSSKEGLENQSVEIPMPSDKEIDTISSDVQKNDTTSPEPETSVTESTLSKTEKHVVEVSANDAQEVYSDDGVVGVKTKRDQCYVAAKSIREKTLLVQCIAFDIASVKIVSSVEASQNYPPSESFDVLSLDKRANDILRPDYPNDEERNALITSVSSIVTEKLH